MDASRILVADADIRTRLPLCNAFAEGGYTCEAVTTAEDAIARVRTDAVDVVFLDVAGGLPESLRALGAIKAARPSTLVVVMAAGPSVDGVIEAFRRGAFDFLPKPVAAAQALALANRGVKLRAAGEERRRLADRLQVERMEVVELRRRLGIGDPFERVVGASRSVRRLIETLAEVARTDSTILITGESGTGKGLVARAVHEASERARGPFVEANCVVYSEGVLHSELFGHEKGAFTGAARQKRGRFELATGGTIFLDEIGEIAPTTQLLLLRVLQDRSYERVGGEETLETDARVIAASNRDLNEAMRRGQFRDDLFYRLNVIPLHLPPLREHPEDIPLLAQHFLARSAERLSRTVPELSRAALDRLAAYRWPGNVRELENAIERVAVLCRGETIDVADLPPRVRGEDDAVRSDPVEGTLEELERVRILQVLEDSAGNKKLAARRLGIHRSTLYAKLRRYGVLEYAAEQAAERRDSRHDASGLPTRTRSVG